MDRRTLLQSLVAVSASSALLPTAAAAHPDAVLIRICAEHIVNLHAYNAAPGGGLSDFESDPLWIAYIATHDAIDAARPQTLDGVIAKARAAKAEGDASPAWADRCPESGPAVSFSWDVVGDLLRLGGQA